MVDKKWVPNLSPDHYLPKEGDLTSIFGDVSQSEKLSEIKPPLLPPGLQFIQTIFSFVRSTTEILVIIEKPCNNKSIRKENPFFGCIF